MRHRLRSCPTCGLVAPTAAFRLIPSPLAVRQHGTLRRVCPDCGFERAARLYAVVRDARKEAPAPPT